MQPKLHRRHRSGLNSKSNRGFTLVEVLIGSIVGTIILAAVYANWNESMMLQSKSVATSATSHEVRYALAIMTDKIRQSVSPAQFASYNGSAITTYSGNFSNSTVGQLVGNATGVSFQELAGGPFLVAADANPSDTSIQIYVGANFTPAVGYRLLMPNFQVEQNVTAVSMAGSGNTRTATVTLNSTIGKTVDVGTVSSPKRIIAYFTRRSAYIVFNGELRHFPDINQPGTFFTIARRMTNATPFSLVSAGSGQQDRDYLALTLASQHGNSTTARYNTLPSRTVSLIGIRSQKLTTSL